MSLRFHITDDLPEAAGTTCGYWSWDQPQNKGTLHIYCVPLPKRRFLAAVIGHELIESAWCKLWGITTEVCDRFDIWMEHEYELGHYPYTFEGGFHKACPYRRGHQMGCVMERIIIHFSFASWRDYSRCCNKAMNIAQE